MRNVFFWLCGLAVGLALAFAAPTEAKWRGINGGTLEDAFNEIDDLQDEVKLQNSELMLVRARLNDLEAIIKKRQR